MEDDKLPIQRLLDETRSIIGGTQGREEKLQEICALLERHVDHYHWVGFYLVDGDKDELVLGPFVGEPTEHLRIPFGKGICGQAAETKETFVVQDTSKETNYLSCSPRVASEIVLPIMKGHRLIGELDIDSHKKAPFTPGDRKLLERVCEMVSELF